MITASKLYDHLACPHRVTMEAFADPAKRDVVSPFLQLLWERGTLFEKEIIATLQIPYVDLSSFKDDDKEHATRAAMDRGEPLIYSGRLSADNLLGEPDLLRQEGNSYVAIDIKSGAGEEGGGDDKEGKPKVHYGVQLALYTDILERLGRSAGRHGLIWDVHRSEVRYELDAPLGAKSPSLWDIYLESRAAVEASLANPSSTLAAAAAPCKLCVWRSTCFDELKAADDLTLLPFLGRAKRDVMRPTLPTIHALAQADLAPLMRKGNKTAFSGVGPDTLRKFQARAQLAIANNPQPYFRDAVALPQHPHEIFFDLETDPLRDLCYLHGFVTRENRAPSTERFIAMFADGITPEAERDAFAAAWAFLKANAQAVVFHYSKIERTEYRKLQKKYPEVCTPDDIEALFAPPRSFDLFYDAIMHTEWPTSDYSLKTLANFLGFDWRDTDPSGAASIEWFHRWVKSGDPAIKERLLLYNEDDCRAMRMLVDGLRGFKHP